ncbi:arginyltransferase [Vibrio sp. SCSIO 43136]|uniref:arginyltransferase n=1 Tax=Vibrio sp. SCSIO 43136 TaxID=2819101 RepID=UPI002074E62E|nr:arginyltransferase [Vibrio sp. SCSIO 43136]USD66254.1 arginyltransferase [Vibrio sp. SCSIO 43136]
MKNKDQTLIRIGLTENHPCSYLDDQQERVAVVMDQALHTNGGYELLMANGFRRSGNTIYKPQCDECSACESLRVNIPDYQPSKSHKRLIKQASRVEWQMKPTLDDDWFELYERYINARHQQGSMYPPKKKEFEEFSTNQWLTTQYLHVYLDDKLVSVAVTDVMDNCASAFYTFYDPDCEISLGTLSVLLQIAYCKQASKQWLYLGYQIDQCQAMSYKVRFKPHQRLVNQMWRG